MAIAMSVAESETIRQELPHDLAVDFDRMFPEFTGYGVARANKKRLSLLKKAAPVLRCASSRKRGSCMSLRAW